MALQRQADCIDPQQSNYGARQRQRGGTGAVQIFARVVNALEPSLDEALVRYVDDQKSFLLQEGFLRNDFSIADFVAPGPLEEARRIVAAEAASRLAAA